MITVKECAVCAWRATCVLKFKHEEGGALGCNEFSRDITIKAQSDGGPDKEDQKEEEAK